MDLIYFPAAFEMYDTLPDLHPKGLDALQFNTLRQDDGGTDRPGWRGDRGSINMVATCCMTVLAVDNVNCAYASRCSLAVSCPCPFGVCAVHGDQLVVMRIVCNAVTQITHPRTWTLTMDSKC